MNERTILDLVSLQNGWWEEVVDFPVRKVFPFKRCDYYYLKEAEFLNKETSVIMGPRGIGKSTILFELIRELIGLPEDVTESSIKKAKLSKENIDPKRIFFVSFEEARLKKVGLLEILKVYAKFILREDITKLSEKIYVFFDEIQEVEDWGSQIKTIQNLQYKIKIFVSGSSSVSMKNEASKAARRLSIYSMHPLKFCDYLRFKLKDPKFDEKLNEIVEFRKKFITLFQKNNSKEIYEQFLKFYIDLKPWLTNIEILFDEYRIKGGYPALMSISDYKHCASKLRDTFWLGFHKDLMVAKGIGDPSGMKSLAEYIASISSCVTNLTSLRELSGATKNSEQLKKYLYHLENAYLVSISHNYNVSPTRKGSKFKIYLSDIAIRNMLQGMLSELMFENENEMGLTTETLIHDHMLRLFFKIRPYVPLMYSRDKKEVDIILKLNSKIIPVEVKKADEPPLSDLGGLRAFCEQHEIPGVVSCGKKLAFEENIIFLPHWLFILIA